MNKRNYLPSSPMSKNEEAYNKWKNYAIMLCGLGTEKKPLCSLMGESVKSALVGVLEAVPSHLGLLTMILGQQNKHILGYGASFFCPSNPSRPEFID